MSSTGTAVDVVMPQMGVSVSEGTVTKWSKQVGDQIEADETLLEISTDKVDTEVPSPAAGTIVEILVQEGETVDVGHSDLTDDHVERGRFDERDGLAPITGGRDDVTRRGQEPGQAVGYSRIVVDEQDASRGDSIRLLDRSARHESQHLPRILRPQGYPSSTRRGTRRRE